MVHQIYILLLCILQLISMILYVLGKVFGIVFDIIVFRSLDWISSTKTRPFVTLLNFLILGLMIIGAWYTLKEPSLEFISRLSTAPSFHAPDGPAVDISDFSTRLRRVEAALSELSLNADRTRTKAEEEARTTVQLVRRLGTLESRIQKEAAKAAEADAVSRQAVDHEIHAVRQQVEILHAQIQAQIQRDSGGGERGGSNEESRAQLKASEERVGRVEGGVKEALELGKKVGGSSSIAWWNKLASGFGSKGLTIKSADGQDVTALIGHLVDSAVSRYSKDTLARPDLALHSAGARVIPSLTSPTFEIRPSSLRGLLTGNGYAVGRPPVTALHYELHSGHCWPFAGSEGQLGVALAAPAYITDISIDHVAKEIAFDLRSAPREMELWGLVEGRDNIAKVKKWKAEKVKTREERRREAEVRGETVSTLEEEDYPRTLPKSPQYIRIASFKYDVHAPNNVQTFPVFEEVRDLGIDFGIAVLRIKSNWGRAELTCLYRLRVHGQRMGEIPLPYEEPVSSP